MTSKHSFIAVLLALSSLIPVRTPPLCAANPPVPGDFFPDPEPHVWADGKLYLYPSHDVGSRRGYCSDNYHVLSTPDLVHWTDHGVSLRLKDAGVTNAVALYACDCVFAGGKYHLYASTNKQQIVELSSDSPTGPFTDPHIIEGLQGIDPAVLVDDDGSVYIYWGQNAGVRCARLKPNLHEIDKATVTQPFANGAPNWFHEGSAVTKIGKTYYYVFASMARKNRPTTLSYATSDSPMGPFTYRGVIIDNRGSDPGVWNNHGRIVRFHDRWHLFHHRSTGGGPFQRQFCIEPITINPDGSIPEVGMTSNGAEDLLDTSEIPCWQMCRMQGNARLEWKEGTWSLAKINEGDVLWFRGYRFKETARKVEALVKASAPATLEIRESEPKGRLLATIRVSPDAAKGFHGETAELTGDLRSVKDFCIVYHGPNGAVELRDLKFKE